MSLTDWLIKFILSVSIYYENSVINFWYWGIYSLISITTATWAARDLQVSKAHDKVNMNNPVFIKPLPMRVTTGSLYYHSRNLGVNLQCYLCRNILIWQWQQYKNRYPLCFRNLSVNCRNCTLTLSSEKINFLSQNMWTFLHNCFFPLSSIGSRWIQLNSVPTIL